MIIQILLFLYSLLRYFVWLNRLFETVFVFDCLFFAKSRGRKRARSGIFGTKSRLIRFLIENWSYRQFSIKNRMSLLFVRQILLSWVLHDFKHSGPFLASEGRKRGQKCNFAKKLHTACSLHAKKHPGQILNFFYVKFALKRLRKFWTSMIFSIIEFQNSNVRIFFQYFAKTKWWADLFIH